MIAGIFHKGSGLGNQLFRYVFVRSLAMDKGYDFGMQNPENFKASSFLKIDMGTPTTNLTHSYTEPRVNHTDGLTDIRTYDLDGVAKITDNTLIDGEFQGEKYFIHRKNEIREWLKIEEVSLPENLCIINFRGGEYVGGQELFLAKKYWRSAVVNMQKINPNMLFRVVTDDVKTAKKFFPDYEISHDFANDYASIQYAKYLILSNSSFAIIPAWLNENVEMVIAPKYWARHNVSDGYWSCGYNIVDGWMYQDRLGNLHSAKSCEESLKAYEENNIKDTSPIYLSDVPFSKRLARLIPQKIRRAINKIT
ncbi:MAG: glycosyl transferase [Patescibacteria group bacterium]